MAPQAFDSADKLKLPAARKQGQLKGLCLVWRAEWVGWPKICQILEIWRRSMDCYELLHPLSTLLTGMVFAFRLVFSLCGTLQGSGRDQPKIRNLFCSTLWTGFCLTSLHTVILLCTMRCPMILNLVGLQSARASGICLFRENKESLWICGNSQSVGHANGRAVHSSDGLWIMAGCPLGSWLEFVEFSGNEVLDSAESLLCVQQLGYRLIEKRNDSALCVKVLCAQKCVLIL